MYQPLSDVKLKNGETVEIGVITAPFDEYASRLHHLLGHKGEEWVWQIDLSLAGKTDALENRFYVARRGEDVLSNVCTFELGRVGLLGHVWTPPAERRKGLANAVLERCLADFRARGGGLMLLSTVYDTPPYHLYEKFGFEGFGEGSGCMRYSTETDFETKYFRAAKTAVVEPSWSAWPRLNALVAECEEFVKSVAYAKFGRTFAEDSWLYVMQALEADERVCVKLLESQATRALVGYAWALPDERFPDVFLLDLYCHPEHPEGYGKLLGAMRWCEAKVQCYVEAGRERKARALEAAGFELEATLRRQLRKHDRFLDLLLYSRSPSP